LTCVRPFRGLACAHSGDAPELNDDCTGASQYRGAPPRWIPRLAAAELAILPYVSASQRDPSAMRAIVLLLTLSTLASVSPLASAVTVLQCKEPDGSVSFRERCPAGSEQVGSRKVNVAGPPDATAQLAEVVRKSPITLYAIPQCDACDLVRQQLQAAKLPFTEHDVATDAAQQEALKAVSGALTVPAVTVGTQLFTGYNRAALDTALKAAGYPLPASAEAAKRE